MTRISALIIGLFVAIACSSQAERLSHSDVLNLRDFTIWAALSDNEEILSQYSYLDSLQFLKIIYQSDSLMVEGYVVMPMLAIDCPIVIFNRGGNREYFSIDEETLIDWIAPIARHGFAVFASQYRDQDEFGGSDINDVLNLMDVAKDYPGTDSTKIGMVGWSRGGLMTYLALTRSDEIDCAVVGGAPSDMAMLVQERPQIDNLLAGLIPAYLENRAAELQRRSPVLWADELSVTPLLILHGEDDQRVKSHQAAMMSEKLDSLSYPHKLIIFENDDHILSNNRALKDREITNWLLMHLKAD